MVDPFRLYTCRRCGHWVVVDMGKSGSFRATETHCWKRVDCGAMEKKQKVGLRACLEECVIIY